MNANSAGNILYSDLPFPVGESNRVAKRLFSLDCLSTAFIHGMYCDHLEMLVSDMACSLRVF